MRMLLQVLPQCFAKNSHAAAVNYSHSGQAGQKCAIHELFDYARGIIHRLPNNVNFTRYGGIFFL